MPARTVPLITDQYYHIFNRGINKQPIFLAIKDYARGKDLINFYSFANIRIRFSKFLILSNEKRTEYLENLKKENNKIVEITSFNLMPNHFHLLIKQLKDNGISKFMSDFQNSLTKYLNIKYKRIGHLLQGQFKAVRIEDDEQLLHVNRYIHINPHTSFIVKDIDALLDYKWSSLPEYLGEVKDEICNKEIILSHFKDTEDYKKFITDQADYQRELGKIKHLILEK
ncbi:hypothetical protein C4577_00590 [Candidatus Parcubacteria bacterium]|nr:MAG: hypothetical protein C4577_00590 [Candidatus Parcubacteria bacterium]